MLGSLKCDKMHYSNIGTFSHDTTNCFTGINGKMQGKWPTNTAGAGWKKKRKKEKTPTGWDICLHAVQTDMSWTLEQIMNVFGLLGEISAWGGNHHRENGEDLSHYLGMHFAAWNLANIWRYVNIILILFMYVPGNHLTHTSIKKYLKL